MGEPVSLKEALSEVGKTLKITPISTAEISPLAADGIGESNPTDTPSSSKDKCPKCQGRGYGEIRGEHGVRYFTCSCPAGDDNCKFDEFWEQLSWWSEISVQLGHSFYHDEASFDDFTIGPKLQGTQERATALKAVRQWAEDGYKQRPWLVLLGSYGTGKTHLAAAALDSLHKRRITAAFAEVPALLDWLRSRYNHDDFDETFRNFLEVPVLILDDLGAQKGTDWVDEKLYRLINYRYSWQFPLLVTSNKPLAQMEGRIASRLGDKAISRIVDCGDFDWRQVER